MNKKMSFEIKILVLVFEYEEGHKLDMVNERRLRELQERQRSKILQRRQENHSTEHAGLDEFHVSVIGPSRKRHEDGDPR